MPWVQLLQEQLDRLDDGLRGFSRQALLSLEANSVLLSFETI